ncbi:MAG: LLM class F420-dependent oxidoreductase [Actinomycetota bacterium]|nr:LLM class F420-dependent oxidoreductase [Actinomycetota bacterium]
MRIGIGSAATNRQGNVIDELVQLAREAHEAGLDFWMSQMTDIDSLTALAVIGREVPDLALGTAVVPTYPRHPLMLAGQALTVQAASANNLTLGIGLSHQIVIEGVFGQSFDKPVRHMREYLEVLMAALHTGKVDFQGDVYRVATFAPMKAAGAEPPAVLVAALGTQMLKLAGRLADGTVLWMVGPKTIESHIVPTIAAAAKEADRPAPRVTVGLPVCLTDNIEAARERAGRTFSLYNDLPSYRAMLDKESVEGPADVAIIGDEATIRAGVARLGDVGATDLNLAVFGNAEERSRTTGLLADLAR